VSTESGSDGFPPGGPPGPVARILLVLIEAYRVSLAPLIGGYCRYVPSCSLYAAEAVRRHGAWRGAGLSLRRLGRCHPFHAGGYDPVP
jgi:putative membrane protein insertion efficiency factor